MKFFMVDNAGNSTPCEVPDDYRMDELFCDINGIGEDVPDVEVHRLMAESDDALSSENGKYIRFADLANSSTTLSQLGINENARYQLTQNTRDNMVNGGHI